MTEQRAVSRHLRGQMQQFCEFLERTMADVPPDLVNWRPGGTVNSIGANYGHLLFAIDRFVHLLLQGRPTLMASTWAGRSGFVPAPEQPPFDAWLRDVQVDLPAARAYAADVYAAAYAYLDGLTDEQLVAPLDLTGIRLGVKTVAWAVDNVLLNHTSTHHGEISCLKGLAGAKGYAV